MEWIWDYEILIKFLLDLRSRDEKSDGIPAFSFWNWSPKFRQTEKNELQTSILKFPGFWT